MQNSQKSQNQANIIDKATAYRLLAAEAVLTALASCSLLLAFGPVLAYSAACGGLAYIVPNLVFARFAFRHSAAEAPELALRWFYFGEAVKLLLTAMLFALIMLYLKPLHFAAMILTFVAMLFINLFGLASGVLNKTN